MEKIDFLATDKIELDGLLYKSNAKTTKVILSVHGMTSNCLKKRENIIAKKANENMIDYFCFNNRGSELAKYITKNEDGKKQKNIGGTTYEDPQEGYNDILGAIQKLEEMGYTNIYLQGHSLGSTKIVYTYNKLKKEKNKELKNIKGIILLSLIDIPTAIKVYLKRNYEEYKKLALQKEKENNTYYLMPKNAFIHPISVKTFLRYIVKNEEIDFAKYGKDNNLEKLNNIDVPLFMRWGNDNEMILQKASKLVEMVNEIIKNNKKDINYIEGANHSYQGKEEIVASQIIDFIKKYK